MNMNLIGPPIEWAAKPARSERMRLGELPRRAGAGQVPDVEPAGAVNFRIAGETDGIRFIRTPIEWAAQPVQSERMRVGAGRVPDVEPAVR
ncbi:hypothetical protein GCM10017784_05650 [Deinococcus indicus]|nr:hypothetical protein GCM10017784_05650 [Deinococcus indicus]